MAHPVRIKAQALAMLLTGDSPRYVAEQTGVPLTTVKRWRNNDMRTLLREIFPYGIATGLKRRMQQNGPKKRECLNIQ